MLYTISFVTSPITWAHTHCLPPPNIISPGYGFQSMDFEGDTNIQSITVVISCYDENTLRCKITSTDPVFLGQISISLNPLPPQITSRVSEPICKMRLP